MRKLIPFISKSFFILILCGLIFSCKKNVEPESPKLDVTETSFDYKKITFTVTTNASDGEELTLKWNEAVFTGKSNGGKTVFDVSSIIKIDEIGGKEFNFVLSCASFTNTKEILFIYSPKIELELTDIINPVLTIHQDFNNFVMPKAKTNFVEEAVDVKWEYYGGKNDYVAAQVTTLDGDDFDLANDFTNLSNFEGFKKFVITESSVNKLVIARCIVTQKNNASNTYALNKFWIVLDENIAGSIKLESPDGLNFYTSTYDSAGTLCGSYGTYKWQVSDDAQNWTDISNTKSYYEIQKEHQNKYLKVIFTQTYESVVQPAKEVIYCINETPKKIMGTLEANIIYNGFIVQNETINPDCFRISSVFNNFGEEINPNTVTLRPADDIIEIYDEDGSVIDTIEITKWDEIPLNVSRFVNIFVECGEYFPFEEEVFIPVSFAFKDEEIPVLSTDKFDITSGCIKFLEGSDGFMFKFGEDGTYQELEAKEYELPEGVNTIYVYKKEIGRYEYPGFINSSEIKTITVNTSNIGVKTTSDGISFNFDKNFIKIYKTNSGKVFTFTAVVNDEVKNILTRDGIFKIKYEWTTDAGAAKEQNCSLNEDGSVFTVNASTWPSDGYMVTLKVKIYVEYDGEQYDYENFILYDSFMVED